MALVQINSVEELCKVLAIQNVIALQAEKEVMEQAGGSMEEFVAKARRVLEKYARYPTLTEYQKVPHLSDAEKWGATFGVSTLVTILVLDHARALLGGKVPEKFHRLFVQFLEKLRGTEPNIVMDDLTKAFAVMSEAYGIVFVHGDKLALTVVGSRVLLHLLDANMFVDEASAAIQKFK